MTRRAPTRANGYPSIPAPDKPAARAAQHFEPPAPPLAPSTAHAAPRWTINRSALVILGIAALTVAFWYYIATILAT